MNSIEIALRYSKVGRVRLHAMKLALKSLDNRGITGDVVECGVWRGGHIILTRLISPKRKCWLYDTFNGMTKPTILDVTRKGISAIDKYKTKEKKGHRWADCDVDDVRNNLIAEGVYNPHLIRFIIGDVEMTLLDENNLPEKIALLRLDTDWYHSTKIEMERLFPRLVPGGNLIVDDYGHWMGARKAVKDYLGARVKQLKPIDYTAVMLTV